MDHWEHTGRKEEAEKGEGWRESKNANAPPVSKDAADRVQHPCRCVWGQTHRIKLHIVRPRLVRYAC